MNIFEEYEQDLKNLTTDQLEYQFGFTQGKFEHWSKKMGLVALEIERRKRNALNRAGAGSAGSAP